MKYLISILLSLSILISVSPVYAQDTKLSDLLEPTSEVKAAEIDTLDQIELDRLKSLQDQLGFVLPEYTDNASLVITFTDPSPDQVGVQLSIDGSNYNKVDSPYTFSALSIGNHDIIFKFSDKDGSPQEIEYMMTVLPRSPIIKSPVLEDGILKISGTGLSNSEVHLFINEGVNEYILSTQVDGDGNWSSELSSEEGLDDGIYTVVGFTRKYGFASEFSKAVVYQIGSDNGIVTEDSKEEIFFSFSSINRDNIKDIISTNKDLIILLGITFLIGSIVALLMNRIISGTRADMRLKKAEQSIKQVSNNSKKEKTLRELFEEEVKKEEPKEIEEKKKPKEKVISKEEFLKDFKSIDPDDNKGKEKEIKPKEIKVSLTSKEE